MSLLQDAAALLKEVAGGIRDLRTIIEAARDGEKFLTRHHPDARKAFADLLEELGKLTEYLADASSIVTAFEFTVTGSDVDRQPRAFNDQLVEREAVFARFDNQLDQTRIHCSAVGGYSEQLATQAKQRGLHNLFGLLNTGKEQAAKLSVLLEDVWGNDTRVLDEFEKMATAVRIALEDVRAALGPPGEMRSENVPAAAQLLGKHRGQFLPIQLQATDAARDLRI